MALIYFDPFLMVELKMITIQHAIEHGLSESEFSEILEVLGRRPNLTELGVFSVMWSEHCSYKTSRMHLDKLPTTGPSVLIGPGENAGVVAIGGGKAAVFKMESHNHPSFIEPFQGAATGVGGILRDVFTMGARPIASLNSLRLGARSHPKTRHLLNGIVGGIAHYGNCMGVPTVGGEVYFDASYNANVLVNVFTIGLVEVDEIFRGVADGVGNPVYYVGSGTGRDGIHGATMASETFEKGDEEKRPTVQVGDPFREKLLLEACLELMGTGAIVGIQDMGAAGLTSSSVEMAHRSGNGLRIDVDLVPKREAGMTAYEVLLSESQERMLMVIDPQKASEVGRVFDKWELEWAKIGTVTDSGNLEVVENGDVVCCLPIDALTSAAPKYDRPQLPFVHPTRVDKIRNPPTDLGEFLIDFIGSANLCSRKKIYSQFDFMVGTNTLKTPGSADAAIVRTEPNAFDLALAVDCPSRKVFLDPREGAKHTVAECTRNLACVNATPLGASDCLNFGDPTKPEIMWQLVEAIEGMADACRVLETPIVSGNVSLYNASDGVDIYPTPGFAAVGAVGAESVSMCVRQPGDVIVIIGRNTNPNDLGASEYLWVCENSIGNRLPEIDLKEEKRLQDCVRYLIEERFIFSAHDCSEGGIGVALLEKLFTSGFGCHIGKEHSGRRDTFLFSETPSRILVTMSVENALKAITLVRDNYNLCFDILGYVTESPTLVWDDFSLNVGRAEESWREGLSSLI